MQGEKRSLSPVRELLRIIESTIAMRKKARSSHGCLATSDISMAAPCSKRQCIRHRNPSEVVLALEAPPINTHCKSLLHEKIHDRRCQNGDMVSDHPSKTTDFDKKPGQISDQDGQTESAIQMQSQKFANCSIRLNFKNKYFQIVYHDKPQIPKSSGTPPMSPLKQSTGIQPVGAPLPPRHPRMRPIPLNKAPPSRSKSIVPITDVKKKGRSMSSFPSKFSSSQIKLSCTLRRTTNNVAGNSKSQKPLINKPGKSKSVEDCNNMLNDGTKKTSRPSSLKLLPVTGPGKTLCGPIQLNENAMCQSQTKEQLIEKPVKSIASGNSNKRLRNGTKKLMTNIDNNKMGKSSSLEMRPTEPLCAPLQLNEHVVGKRPAKKWLVEKQTQAISGGNFIRRLNSGTTKSITILDQEKPAKSRSSSSKHSSGMGPVKSLCVPLQLNVNLVHESQSENKLIRKPSKSISGDDFNKQGVPFSSSGSCLNPPENDNIGSPAVPELPTHVLQLSEDPPDQNELRRALLLERHADIIQKVTGNKNYKSEAMARRIQIERKIKAQNEACRAAESEMESHRAAEAKRKFQAEREAARLDLIRLQEETMSTINSEKLELPENLEFLRNKTLGFLDMNLNQDLCQLPYDLKVLRYRCNFPITEHKGEDEEHIITYNTSIDDDLEDGEIIPSPLV